MFLIEQLEKLSQNVSIKIFQYFNEFSNILGKRS